VNDDDRPMPITGLEQPYQLVMVAVIVELLALLVLVPNEIPTEPHVVGVVSGIRFVALVMLAGLVRHESARKAWPALLVWAALTAPPELWAHALEGTAFRAALMFAGGLVFALCMHTLARVVGRWWFVVGLVLIGLALAPSLLPGWPALEVWVLPLTLIAAWGWWRELRAPGTRHA
jgi:hypothetical protein